MTKALPGDLDGPLGASCNCESSLLLSRLSGSAGSSLHSLYPDAGRDFCQSPRRLSHCPSGGGGFSFVAYGRVAVNPFWQTPQNFRSAFGGMRAAIRAAMVSGRAAVAWCAVAVLVAASPVIASDPVRIVMMGDSLFAGFGLDSGEGLVPQLQDWLDARGEAVELVNAGVSGDTAAAGRMRLDWSVGDDADAVVLALGANDMLRGFPPADTRANLEAMIKRLQERGLPVLLVGMRASDNLGPKYVAAFDAIYPDLALAYSLLLMPFLLEGVALDPTLNLDDGIHPNAAGVVEVTKRLGPYVAALAEEVRSGRP